MACVLYAEGREWGRAWRPWIASNMSPVGHDTSTKIIVHAGFMIRSHACTMIIVHACTMIIVLACTLIIVHACTKIAVHTCNMIIVLACPSIMISSTCMYYDHFQGLGVCWFENSRPFQSLELSGPKIVYTSKFLVFQVRKSYTLPG